MLFPEGYAIFTISFSGKFSSSGNHGIYLTQKNHDYQLVAMLQPIFARTVFPCFDEPCFKSNFTLHLFVENSENIAVSNMPIKNILKYFYYLQIKD